MTTDMVIAATGQKSDLAIFAGKDKVETTNWGSIKADTVTCKTSVKASSRRRLRQRPGNPH